MKPIPKSLHTVTVLVAVAKTTPHYAEWFRDAYNGHDSSLYCKIQLEMAVDSAIKILSLSESPDTYGLRDQAIRKLSKDAAAALARFGAP